MTGPLTGVVTGVIAALVERGKELDEQQDREYRAQKENETAGRRAYNVERLVEALAGRLGIAVDASAVVYDLNQSPTYTVEVEGQRFGLGSENKSAYHRDEGLLVQVPCAKGCGKPLWVLLEKPSYRAASEVQLYRMLTTPQQHDWHCLQQFDENGDPTTGYNGEPLPPPRPRVPTEAERYQQATDVYSNLVKLRRELQFQKAIEKEEAIARVLASGVAKSATAAEKLVETDKQYAALCRTLTETIVSEIRAKETMIAARPHSQHEPVGGPEDAP